MRTNDRLQIASVNVAFFRTHVLAIALTAVASLASANTATAQAPSEPADPGVRCAAKVGPGQYEFYLPGEKATDVNGQKWVCGPDGQWFRDYSSLTVGGTRGSTTVSANYLIAPARASAVMR